MAITKEIKLIFADVTDNHNKFWTGELYDSGDVVTRWGRVGYGEQSKTFSGAGESFLLKKEREKINKGYTPLRVVSSAGATGGTVKVVNNLAVIAHQELSKSNPELAKLVDRLVQANIHNITSQTNITYNATTGLFQTPLGIVTPDGISDARNLLVEIKQIIEKDKKGDLTKLVGNYLRIIPQDVGMKLRVESIFPDVTAVQKQSDILDSLDASLKSMMVAPPPTPGQTKVEKVFEVDLGVLSERDNTYNRLVKYYENSQKAIHGYGHIKIRKIYTVKIGDMDKGYASKMSNQTEVYHGTSQANLLSILKSGLKVSPPSTAYIAGKMFGNGIYGAINSSKSLGYTFGRWGGSSSGDSGWLFVCDFAMGNIHYPHGRCSSPASGCDSVWAKSANCGLHHDELIVYKNNQVNIKYLLECK